MKHTLNNLREKWSDFKWSVYVGKYDDEIVYLLFILVSIAMTMLIIKVQ